MKENVLDVLMFLFENYLYDEPEEAPDRPTYLELTYQNGDIIAIDGETMSPARVLETLNTVCALAICRGMTRAPRAAGLRKSSCGASKSGIGTSCTKPSGKWKIKLLI